MLVVLDNSNWYEVGKWRCEPLSIYFRTNYCPFSSPWDGMFTIQFQLLLYILVSEAVVFNLFPEFFSNWFSRWKELLACWITSYCSWWDLKENLLAWKTLKNMSFVQKSCWNRWITEVMVFCNTFKLVLIWFYIHQGSKQSGPNIKEQLDFILRNDLSACMCIFLWMMTGYGGAVLLLPW